MSTNVHCHSSHGVMPGKSWIRFARRGPRLRLTQPDALALDHQLGIFAQLHAVLLSKDLCPFSNKINMRALTQYQPRCPDRIADSLHAANATGAKCGSIHDQRIHLHAAVAGKKAAVSGVEDIVFFHHHYSFFHGLERSAALGQDVPASVECLAYSVLVRFRHLIRNGPGPAMNKYHWSH